MTAKKDDAAADDAHMDDAAPNDGNDDEVVVVDDDDDDDDDEDDNSSDAGVPVAQDIDDDDDHNNDDKNNVHAHDNDIAAATVSAALATLTRADDSSLNEQAVSNSIESAISIDNFVHAFGFQWARIRCSCREVYDEGVLNRLESNDASIDGLSVEWNYFMQSHHHNLAKRVGEAIGNSTHLQMLCIEDHMDVAPFGLPSFFMGLARNRSIQRLIVQQFNHSHMDIFTTLAPFFAHNHNLRSIEITSFEIPTKMKVPSLVSALVSTSTLEHIDLSNNDLSDKKAADIINALRSMPGLHHLVELDLGGNMIRKKGCMALRKLLRHPASKLQVLHLYHNHLDDACIDILFGGLVDNKSIKFLNLHHQMHVSASGWGVFFDVLANSDCSLVRIMVSENIIGDSGAISIGESLAVNGKVKMLHMRDCRSINSVGWQGFSKALLSPTASIMYLDLTTCNIDDIGAVAIASALATNTSLEGLLMEGIRSITSTGWREFFRRLTNCQICQWRKLNFCGTNIDDVGTALLVSVLSRMRQLVFFHLDRMNAITANGWGLIAEILTRSACINLKELKLGNLYRPNNDNTAMDDAVVLRFADALIGNTTLNKLSFGGRPFSGNGLTALANVICNKSSIERTFSSNHTITFGCYETIPRDLQPVFKLNYENDKTAVARKKILMHYTMLDVLRPISAPVLPTALAWLGKDLCEYSIMFQFLQSMPWLMEAAA